MNPLRCHIRWMLRRDMPEVLAIEGESFEFPWLEDDFDRCLRQRNCIGMVAVDGENKRKQVVGFMIYALGKTKLDILNFAVAPEYQRRGIGRQMVDKLKSNLSLNHRRRLIAEVREANLPAQLFFRACGLRAVSTINRAYDDTPEDAYRMQYCIGVVSTKLTLVNSGGMSDNDNRR